MDATDPYTILPSTRRQVSGVGRPLRTQAARAGDGVGHRTTGTFSARYPLPRRATPRLGGARAPDGSADPPDALIRGRRVRVEGLLAGPIAEPQSAQGGHRHGVHLGRLALSPLFLRVLRVRRPLDRK